MNNLEAIYEKWLLFFYPKESMDFGPTMVSTWDVQEPVIEKKCEMFHVQNADNDKTGGSLRKET